MEKVDTLVLAVFVAAGSASRCLVVLARADVVCVVGDALLAGRHALIHLIQVLGLLEALDFVRRIESTHCCNIRDMFKPLLKTMEQ